MTRCINIDWLEVYAHEIQDNIERNAAFYESRGLQVECRPYGTRQYEEMFTIMDEWNEKWIEIRRKPKGLQTQTGFSLLDEGSCHVRLCNRTCYSMNPAQIMIQFCEQYGLIISRISRLDICLDFEKFDSGDEPQKFINRYLQGRYSKINQANIRANGKDLWDGRAWNSLSWGAEKSQVTTKIYNKTLELAERKDKPYIRQAWASAGLITDFVEMTKQKPDGTTYKPQIWRLEFSIKSSVKKWYVIEDVHTSKRKIRSIHHTLEEYQTKDQLMQHFAGLCGHYFFFKHFQQGQRKDRCKDKTLFDFSQVNTFYEVQHIATAKTPSCALQTLKSRLLNYRLTHSIGAEAEAIDAVLNIIRTDELHNAASSPENLTELMLMQSIISRAIAKKPCQSIEDERKFIESIVNLQHRLF